MGRPLWFRLRGKKRRALACFSCSIAGRKKKECWALTGGFFPFSLPGVPFSLLVVGWGKWVGVSPLSLLDPNQFFFPFWCLINNKREERDLHCAVVQLSIRFVLFSFRDLLEDVLFETLGFMGTPRPFEPLSWALCPFLGSLKGETKTIPLWHLGKEKQKQKKQRLFFKGAVFCFVDLSFGAKKKELCNDTTDQCLFFIHARYDNAETGRKQRIGWLN